VAMTAISAAALLASLLIWRSSMDTVRLAVPQQNRMDNEWACRGTQCNVRPLRPMEMNRNIGK
jgi:hypothetical protein